MFKVDSNPPKGMGPKVFWVFAVENAHILDRWMTTLHATKYPDQNFENEVDRIAKREMQKIQEEERKIQLKKIEEEEAENNRKEKERLQKIEDVQIRQKEKREKEAEKAAMATQAEIEKKLTMERLKEAQLKKEHEEFERKQRIKYQDLLEHSWDYRFQKIWSE